MEPFAIAPNHVAKRRMAQGHKLNRPELCDGFDNLYVIKCDCGWFTTPFLKEDREKFEEIAWQHRTTPVERMPGSSDILYASRMEDVNALVAKLRRR